jgi:hypothetical protein
MGGLQKVDGYGFQAKSEIAPSGDQKHPPGDNNDYFPLVLGDQERGKGVASGIRETRQQMCGNSASSGIRKIGQAASPLQMNFNNLGDPLCTLCFPLFFPTVISLSAFICVYLRFNDLLSGRAHHPVSAKPDRLLCPTI